MSSGRALSLPQPIASPSTSTLPAEPSSSRPAPSDRPRRSHSDRPVRSTSALTKTSPFLPEHLRPHDFVLPSVTSSSGAQGLTGGFEHVWNGPGFEAKHAGPSCLKRIFIGPHRATSSGGALGGEFFGARATRVERDRDEDEDENTTGSSDDSSDDNDFEDDEEGARERSRRREDRARWKRLAAEVRQKNKDKQQGKRIPTGETIRGGTMKPSGSRKSSIHQWVGGSFEIGGDVREAMKRRDEARARARSASTAAETASAVQTAASKAQATFVTARTHPQSSLLATEDYSLKQPSPEVEASLPPELAHALLRRPSDVQLGETASLSAAPLLESSTFGGLPEAPRDSKGILRDQAHASLGHGHPSTNGHAYPQHSSAYLDEFGRPQSTKSMPPPAPARMESTTKIRFSQPLLARPLFGDEPPRPVDEVLARPDDADRKEVKLFLGPEGVAKQKRPGKHDVLRKERMLVKVEWTAREDLPDEFDENAARKFPTTGEGWEEYGVVWRPGRIELWSEYVSQGQLEDGFALSGLNKNLAHALQAVSAASFFLGHKKLAHVIPLAPARTKLSLYSSPDVIFCLTFQPDGHGLIGGAAEYVTGRGKKAHESSDDAPTASKATRTRYIHRRSGTCVFIFRTRSMSVAKEWMWELFRALGKTLPERLEITVAALGAKIHLPIPNDLQVAAYGAGRGSNAHQAGIGLIDDEATGGWRKCKPHEVVAACLAQLKRVTEWQSLLAERDPSELKLCWRRGHTLDWVDMFGKADAEWALVCGFSLRQAHLEPSLELLLGLHYPTTVRVPATPSTPAHRLAEPPAIEGYIARLRPNGSSERIYLSTHDGHLFICSPSSCHPPDPPTPAQTMTLNPAVMVLAPFALGWGAAIAGSERKREKLWERISRSVSGASGLSAAKDRRKRDRALQAVVAESEDGLADQDWVGKLDAFEKRRAIEQILDAKGYLDLRDVARVGGIEDADSVRGDEYGTAQSDVGGEEGMAQAKDRALLAKRRTFVIETKMGISTKFECFSIAVRDEWVGRLGALVTYWTRRERVDALEQMQLHPAGSPTKRAQTMARLRREAAEADAALGPRAPSPEPRSQDRDAADDDDDENGATYNGTLLNKAFNWCVLEGCRSIIRCGRFYIKEGLRGHFKERYLVLLAGTLLEYQTHQRDMHGQLVATSYHRRLRTISLRGCFVYSGQLTSPLLATSAGSSSGGWDPADAQHRFPRIYTDSDGLRVSDEEEDCTLVLFKRRGGGHDTRFGKQGTSHVLRARSRIERDEWVFALNAAIEKLQHAEKAREEKLKEFAWLDKV